MIKAVLLESMTRVRTPEAPNNGLTEWTTTFAPPYALELTQYGVLVGSVGSRRILVPWGNVRHLVVETIDKTGDTQPVPVPGPPDPKYMTRGKRGT